MVQLEQTYGVLGSSLLPGYEIHQFSYHGEWALFVVDEPVDYVESYPWILELIEAYDRNRTHP